AEVLPYLGCAPEAVGAAKRLARSLGPRIDDAVLEHAAQALTDIWQGDEVKEGVSAFFEKRVPAWKTS
ncbi:MAG: enoyl-CoA hydratase, partial [Pseudomonadota bacterium]